MGDSRDVCRESEERQYEMETVSGLLEHKKSCTGKELFKGEWTASATIQRDCNDF